MMVRLSNLAKGWAKEVNGLDKTSGVRVPEISEAARDRIENLTSTLTTRRDQEEESEMWRTAEEIGEDLRITVDTPTGSAFWLILAHRRNDRGRRRTLFVWCDPQGDRAIAFKEQQDAKDLAETLETTEMQPFLSFQEDFKNDEEDELDCPEDSIHFFPGTGSVH